MVLAQAVLLVSFHVYSQTQPTMLELMPPTAPVQVMATLYYLLHLRRELVLQMLMVIYAKILVEKT